MVCLKGFGRSNALNLMLLISLIPATLQNRTAKVELVKELKKDSKILGLGLLVLIKEFKFMAFLKIGAKICGGVLITKYIMLTAAKCIFKVTRPIFGYMGVQNIIQLKTSLMVQKRKAISAAIHPQYKAGKGFNIACVKFASPFLMTVKVGIAKLAGHYSDYSRFHCKIIGYAAAILGLNGNQLHSGDTFVWEDNRKNCKSDSPDPICIKHLIKGIPTQADPGSPLMYKGKVVGLLSEKRSSKKIEYENISAYKQWITLKTSNSPSCRGWNLSIIVSIVLLFNTF